jgi:hypothetical protein
MQLYALHERTKESEMGHQMILSDGVWEALLDDLSFIRYDSLMVKYPVPSPLSGMLHDIPEHTFFVYNVPDSTLW